jgi:hypothetical protein
MSVVPPAGKGTTMRIGAVGCQLPWARSPGAASSPAVARGEGAAGQAHEVSSGRAVHWIAAP